MISRLKPVHLYLLFIAFNLLAHALEGPLGGFHYIFSVIGFGFFFMAVRRYFTDGNSPQKFN